MVALASQTTTPNEVFVVDLAQLAREIAMDILPLQQILELHRLTDEEWTRIQQNEKFKQMLGELVREWTATSSTIDRTKIKAATGVESTIEIFIRAIADESIPLNQRVEAGRFLARLGELDGAKQILGAGAGGVGGGGFSININFSGEKQPVTIEGQALRTDDDAATP